MDDYIGAGKVLTDGAKYIDDDIRATINGNIQLNDPDPQLFYYLEASSGEGKSQLAEALSLPVIYVPLCDTGGNAQGIYRCFADIGASIKNSLKNDVQNLDLTYDKISSAHDMMRLNDRFKTVGCLVELFRLVYGKSNEESLRILSGCRGELVAPYSALTIREGTKALRAIISGGNADKFPLVFLDEVPALERVRVPTNSAYLHCVVLRNICRCLQLVCLLSGTESSAMNTIDTVSPGSRTEGKRPVYMKLITKLPPTNLSVFEAKYHDVCKKLSKSLIDMLAKTRPLFVDYILKAFHDNLTVDADDTSPLRLTHSILMSAKNKIMQRKNFTGMQGLYGHLAILHHGVLHDTAVRNVEDEK